MHCRCELIVQVSDLIIGIFSCVDRLRTVLYVCSEKDVCMKWVLSVVHKLHLSLVGEYGCAFSRITHVSMRSVLLSVSFQMCSLSNVADDLCLSLINTHPALDLNTNHQPHC